METQKERLLASRYIRGIAHTNRMESAVNHVPSTCEMFMEAGITLRCNAPSAIVQAPDNNGNDVLRTRREVGVTFIKLA